MINFLVRFSKIFYIYNTKKLIMNILYKGDYFHPKTISNIIDKLEKLEGEIITQSYKSLADPASFLIETENIKKRIDSLENIIDNKKQKTSCQQFTTVIETYEFKNCWVETSRFKKEDSKINYVDFYDKQTDDKKITIDNIDWLNEEVIYENFKNNGINTNIIPDILYAIKDTYNKIKNNE